VADVTTKDDLREFLTTRRAKLTPDQAGLPVYGANRRVTGLRREEVALLAGISVEYYTRLERGSVGTVSDGVLDGIVHALQLDEAERDHLYRLVRTLATPRAKQAPRRTPAKTRVRPAIQRILDQMPMPAYLRNGRFDILAANDCVAFLRAEAGRDPYDKTSPTSSASCQLAARSSGTAGPRTM
jgi:transcriptional regulator with XRE-family HTH domain